MVAALLEALVSILAVILVAAIGEGLRISATSGFLIEVSYVCAHIAASQSSVGLF